VGEEEVKTGKFKVKNLQTGKEEIVSEEAIGNLVK
jgi:histidyl-tRNA synthetase